MKIADVVLSKVDDLRANLIPDEGACRGYAQLWRNGVSESPEPLLHLMGLLR